MTNLERVVKNGIRSLEREVERKIRSDSYNIKEWNGRKVIPVEKWKKLCSKTPDIKILIEYLPDEYIDHVFFDVSLEGKEKDVDSWFDDWAKYLHENKKASFGRYRCRSCILNPETRKYKDNIYDVIMKGTETEYPCKIVNMYECPYQENDIRELHNLKKIWELTLDSVSYNEYLTWCNDHTYLADFEKNYCEKYFNLHRTGEPNARYNLEDMLKIHEITNTPQRTLQELYNILTDKKLLDVVIDQYIQHKKNDSHYSKESEIVLEVKNLELIKKSIISYFVAIKNDIKLEELRNHIGHDFKQEELEDNNNGKNMEWYKQRFPDQAKHMDKPRNGLCMNCVGFANILCINCNKWICRNHCREHKEKFHNKTSSTVPTLQSKHFKYLDQE